MALDRRRIGLALAGCALLGCAAGAAWPPPPIPKSDRQSGEWSLPDDAALARFSDEAFKAASQGLKWDPAGTAASGPKTWRLAGFVNGTTSTALIEAKGGARQPQRAVAGDSLPDGSRLTRIDGNTITTELDGCTQVYQLYRTKPLSQSGSCQAAPDDAETRKTP